MNQTVQINSKGRSVSPVKWVPWTLLLIAYLVVAHYLGLDMTGVARTIVAKTFAPYEIFISAAIIYLILTWFIQKGFGLLEARMSRYARK